MVGRLFRVAFSKIARRRLKEITDHKTRTASPAVSKKIRTGILNEAQKLEKLPESKPILPSTENNDYEVRYTKAWSYKIIFRVLGDIVRVLSIRHDKEDPEDVKKDLE